MKKVIALLLMLILVACAAKQAPAPAPAQSEQKETQQMQPIEVVQPETKMPAKPQYEPPPTAPDNST